MSQVPKSSGKRRNFMMGQIAGQGDVAALYRFATRRLQLCYEIDVSIRLRIVLTARSHMPLTRP